MCADKYRNFGQEFVNKYTTLTYFLSRGANGSVYGPIQWNAMQLAIKQTTFAAGKDTGELKRDIEAKKDILASIEHKHLIRIHSIDLSQLPKAMYIVMEYAAGGSLREALKSLGGSGQKLPIDILADWAKQIADGMLYLHEKNIVHRDLKSSNILLMEPFDIRKPRIKMALKIADFDEVKDHDHTTTMSFVGTVAYMAPEVIVEQRFSKGSDVWSYGVVIWEMQTGDTPHKGLESRAIMCKAINGELDDLKIEESFPLFSKQLLNRCLKPNLKQRASFHDVVSILQDKYSMASENCSICFQKMAVPRELPCKHVFCMDCVKNVKEKAGRNYHLSCPKCGALFSIAFVPKDSMDPPRYVREKYKQNIKATHDLDIIKHSGKIMGMTSIGDELFIVCTSPPNVIFRYDIRAENKEPSKPTEMSIFNMKWPRGIAASKALSCLYITDWHKTFGGRLWRYKYQKGKEAKQEDPVAITFDVQPFGVSVSQKTEQVLVACATYVYIFARRGWIYIYKPQGSDFMKIRTIDLPDLESPRHCIMTMLSNLIVCHGWNSKIHGVTSYLDDESESIRKKSFYGSVSGSGSGEQEMNRPLSIIQDEDGLILVVDYCNNRIQLLTEDLQLVRHLITSGIDYPRHVCLHAKTGRMYVGQEDGMVQIYDALIAKE